MKRKLLLITLFITLTLTWANLPASAREANGLNFQLEERVDPLVLSAVQQGETEFLVVLKEQADLSGAADLESKAEKGAYVFETLTGLAARTQKPVKAILKDSGVPFQSFWITNAILVRGDYQVLNRVAQLKEVGFIAANPTVRLDAMPLNPESMDPLGATTGVVWNVEKINAPRLWAMGYTGRGIVVGGQDTGYDWDHPALINQYRGWNRGSADHNYNWHDAISNNPEPHDPHGHGTHTMGTMVGDDGGSNQIGVAPGAKWIGCRNMDSDGDGTPASYMACYQWFIAPTDLNNQNPDPSKAPHVINNSWSCPVEEGCTYPEILLPAVQAVRAAGILTVHSAGNKGYLGCETVAEPATIYGESFSVGATYSNDTIVGFSSRGPVTVDGSNRLKPNVVAPGAGIYSSYPNGYYGSSSGTSMAAPHVAGLAALLMSAKPNLIGQVEQVETVIEASALPLTTTQNCGDVSGSAVPNNTYGWGRVDALAAMRSMIEICAVLTGRVYPTTLFPATLGECEREPGLIYFGIDTTR
jgi:subtilisin family serine protease